MECSFVICKADYKANTTLQHPLPITFGNILKYWQVEEGGGGTERTETFVLCKLSCCIRDYIGLQKKSISLIPTSSYCLSPSSHARTADTFVITKGRGLWVLTTRSLISSSVVVPQPSSCLSLTSVSLLVTPSAPVTKCPRSGTVSPLFYLLPKVRSLFPLSQGPDCSKYSPKQP